MTTIRGQGQGSSERNLILEGILNDTTIPMCQGSAGFGRVELFDVLFFGYLTAVLVLVVIFGENPSETLRRATIYGGFFIAGLIILLWHAVRSGRGVFFCRVWYVPFLYVFLFEELGRMIHLIQPGLFDGWALYVELKVFGEYPTVWLQDLVSPWLTELMSSFYMTYYFLIPVLGLTLYRRRQWADLKDFIVANTITFYFCFLHYLFMPVAGPIFVRESLPFDLVPLNAGPLTAFEQWLFFKGAIQGGAFPSSHVAVAVVVLSFAFRCGIYPYVFAVTVTGLAVSTVYHGYHYGIDVIYGVAVGLLFSYVGPRLNQLWMSLRTASGKEASGSRVSKPSFSGLSR